MDAGKVEHNCYSTYPGGWVYLMTHAASWLAADSGSLALGLQDVAVFGDHEDRDEVHHS